MKKYNLANKMMDYPKITSNIKISEYFKKESSKIFENLDNKINSVFKEMSNAEITYTAFLDYDIPPHHFMSHGNIKYIISTRENDDTLKKTNEVNIYFAKIFDERIKNRIIKSWTENSLLSDRLELLMQALDCYEKELYGPVVSTFATQIEGVIKQKINKRFDSVSTKKLIKIIKKLFSKKGIGSTDLTTSKYYEEKFIVSNRDLPSNRHSIAHGNIANYTSKIDAVRMMLIFDSIVTRLEVIDENLLLEE